MDTQVDRCPGSGDESATDQCPHESARKDFLSLAARYLQMALEDNDLSDDEEEVLESLHELPQDAQETSAAAALSRYVASAQTSGQQLTAPERELIVQLADLLKQHPQPDLPGLSGLLDVINNFVSNGTPDRPLSASEQQVVRLLLSIVRSGQLDGPSIDSLLALVARLAMDGASLSSGLYGGLDKADVAQIKAQASAAGYVEQPAQPSTTPPSSCPAAPASNPVADRYLAAAMTDGILSPTEQAAHQALLQLPEQSLPTTTCGALLRFVLIAQNSDGQISPAELNFIQRLVDTLRINPQGDAPGLLGMIKLFIDVLTNTSPERSPTPAELVVFSRTLTMIRSGQYDEPALSQIFDTIEQLALEGAHLYYGIYSGLTDGDVYTFDSRLPAAGSTAIAADTAARAADAAASSTSDTALSSALHAAATALREGSAVLGQIADGNIPPEGGDAALADIAKARAELAPFVAQGDAAAVAADAQLASLDTLLHMALATAGPDLRQTLKDQLGDAVDPAFVDQLSIDQVHELLQLDDAVIQTLLRAGMTLPDVLRLGPTVSTAEIAQPSFATVLHDRLLKGDSADDGLLWARYTGLASPAELSNPQFRADLTEARHLHPEASLASHVHDARCLALYRQLGATVPLETIQAQNPEVIQQLLAKDPAMVSTLAAAGVPLPTIAAATPEQMQALLSANAEVLKALLGAGMALADAASLASTVSVEEVSSPDFIQVLHDKLAAGTPAAEALVWARFTPLASPEELNDPQFIQDLLNAPAKGYGESPTSCLFYARANLLARRLGNTVSVEEILKLDGATINKLLALDPAQIQQFMSLGMSLTQFAQLSDEQRAALLAADTTLVKAMLGAGMSPTDVATYAATVVTPAEATPEFIENIRQRIAQGASGPAAIAGARYGELISAAELANPDFTHSLLFPAESGIPPSQGALATTLTSALGYARDHVDIFEAAEHVAIGSGNAHNGWFANAGVFQLASMNADSAEWAQIEATLERPLSLDERLAAISSAKGMADNWSTLCSLADPLNLHLREGTSDVLDFTSDNLREVNFSPLVAMLGNSPASLGSQSMNIVSALDYLRQHIDLFEAAEQVAVSSTNPHNGWFASAGVFQLAGLSADSPKWTQIETTLGRQISLEDRATAIAAAKGVSDNWSTLCANASAIGLSLREDTTDIIDFTDDNLSQLNFAPLVPLLSQPLAIDRLHTLHDARAQTVVKQLSDPQSNPAPGAELQTVLSLNLSADEAARLLALDPEAARTLLSRGAPLDQIAQLSPEQTDPLIAIDPALLSWLTSLVGSTLSEIAKLTSTDLQDLQSNMLASYRPARSDEVITDIKPESIGHPMDLGGGALTFETQSGQKIIVTKASNPALYSKAIGLLLERSKQKVDELRAQNGLPPEPNVNVSELPTTVPVNPEDPSAGFYTVGQLTLKNLLDAYRSGFTVRHGTATTNGSVVTYQLDDGTQIVVDKNLLKTDRAKQTFDKLIAGQAVSEDDLKHLESDDGSEDLFEGDDWDTWMRFTTQIADSDPRSQLARALEARNALTNGYELLPYYEADGPVGSTYRTYPGGEDDPNFQTMSPADLRELLNEGEINNRISALMANPTIQADYQAALSGALNNLPNRQEVADSLYNALTGPEYIDTLRDFKDNSLAYEAEQMTQRDLSALAMLDPARALDAAQKLRINSLGAEFQELADNPSRIDEETFSIAMTDSIGIFLQSLRSASGLSRHTTQALIDMVENLSERDVQSLSKVVRELVIQVRAGGGGGATPGNVTQAQFEDAMGRVNIPLEQRGKLTQFFAGAQKAGVWGSIAGAAAMASFGYRLSKGAWGPDSTPMERWGAARDLISFLSVGTHVAKTGATAVDFVLNKLVPGEESQRAWKALGLDRSLPELWGKKSFLPSQNTPPDPARQPLLADAVEDGASHLWTEYDSAPERTLAGVSDDAGRNIASAADNLGSIWSAGRELKPLGNIATRIGLSAFKVLSTVADLVGVADIVMGALGLKKAIEDGDGGMIAANALNIAGGAALTGAGIIGTASLFAALPAVIAAAAAPLFLVGTVLALGGFIVTMIVASIKRHNQLQDSSNKQGDWFRALANDGLAYGDWGDKLEYLRYAYAWYGNDNTDPNRSYFDVQQAEWDYFRNTPQDGGSSLNRLNDGLHVHSNTTWAPPDSDSGRGMDM